MEFKPCYTWPNKAFPFRLYFNDQGLRIFIIENIFHNHEWLKRYAKGIGDRDKFIVILGWHHGDWHAKHSKDCINDCGIDIKNFHVLCNDTADFAIFSQHGFNCYLVNQNCFLDYDLFSLDTSIDKIYDAIYVARLTPFKRHHLCDQVPNLALVCGDLHGGAKNQYIPPMYTLMTTSLAPKQFRRRYATHALA